MDSRAFTRVMTTHQIYVTDESQAQHTGRIRDISLGGLFVIGVVLAVGAVVDVAIVLAPDVRIDARGHVARATPEGVGIALDVLEGPESYGHLQRLVLLNTRTDEQTHRVDDEIESQRGMKILQPT